MNRNKHVDDWDCRGVRPAVAVGLSRFRRDRGMIGWRANLRYPGGALRVRVAISVRLDDGRYAGWFARESVSFDLDNPLQSVTVIIGELSAGEAFGL